jgi:hypothetical protein
MADFMTKSGSRLTVEGPEPFLPLPTVQFKAIAAVATRMGRPQTLQTNQNIFSVTRLFHFKRSSLQFPKRHENSDSESYWTQLHEIPQIHDLSNKELHWSRRPTHGPLNGYRGLWPTIGLRLQYFQKCYLKDEWEPSLNLDFLKDHNSSAGNEMANFMSCDKATSSYVSPVRMNRA